MKKFLKLIMPMMFVIGGTIAIGVAPVSLGVVSIYAAIIFAGAVAEICAIVHQTNKTYKIQEKIKKAEIIVTKDQDAVKEINMASNNKQNFADGIKHLSNSDSKINNDFEPEMGNE